MRTVSLIKNTLGAAALVSTTLLAGAAAKEIKPDIKLPNYEIVNNATENPKPVAGALALELLGFGAAGIAEKKQKRAERRQARLDEMQRQAEEAKRAAEEKRAKMEAKRQEEARIAKEEAELKAKLEAEELERKKQIEKESIFYHTELKGHSEFPLHALLGLFGVKNIDSIPIPDRKSSGRTCQEEYYTAEDGKTVVAGIQHFYPDPEHPEYNDICTYRYVRKYGTGERNLYEVGVLHYISEDGRGNRKINECRIDLYNDSHWREDNMYGTDKGARVLSYAKERPARFEDNFPTTWINSEKSIYEKAREFARPYLGIHNWRQDNNVTLDWSYREPQKLDT